MATLRRIAILGSANFSHDESAEPLRQYIEQLFEKHPYVQVVTSSNEGVDLLVQDIVMKMGRRVEVIDIPERGTRSHEAEQVHSWIASKVDKVVVFWDGAGSHTRKIAEIALNNSRPLEVKILTKENI